MLLRQRPQKEKLSEKGVRREYDYRNFVTDDASDFLTRPSTAANTSSRGRRWCSLPTLIEHMRSVEAMREPLVSSLFR